MFLNKVYKVYKTCEKRNGFSDFKIKTRRGKINSVAWKIKTNRNCWQTFRKFHFHLTKLLQLSSLTINYYQQPVDFIMDLSLDDLIKKNKANKQTKKK